MSYNARFIFWEYYCAKHLSVQIPEEILEAVDNLKRFPTERHAREFNELVNTELTNYGFKLRRIPFGRYVQILTYASESENSRLSINRNVLPASSVISCFTVDNQGNIQDGDVATLNFPNIYLRNGIWNLNENPSAISVGKEVTLLTPNIFD